MVILVGGLTFYILVFFETQMRFFKTIVFIAYAPHLPQTLPKCEGVSVQYNVSPD